MNNTRFSFAAAVALVAMGLGVLTGCGSGGSQPDTVAMNAYGAPVISPQDVKLTGDFSRQILISRGKTISFDALQIEGSAYIDPGKGLSVNKGGINEITDPSFEGSDWQLGPGALIDSQVASVGQRSLRIDGQGVSQVVARLMRPVKVVSGETRTISFDYLCEKATAGGIRVVMNAMDNTGLVIGSRSSLLDLTKKGWQRTGGLIYDLPQGTVAYTIEITTEDFAGICNLDAFLAEPKDFFTPYFDGDSENCIWVDAATPQNFASDSNQVNSMNLFKGVIMSFLAMGMATASFLIIVKGFLRRRYSWMILSPLITLPVILFIMTLLGIIYIPDFVPLKITVPGSHLEPNHTYYYRISSVDAAGRESPPSIESRVRTGLLDRKALLTWDRDPEAVKYRIYRGDATYEQTSFYEVNGSAGVFTDTGNGPATGKPSLDTQTDSATPHASRSLRPEPDARISNTVVGLDTSEDFWLTGEVEFGFFSDMPFKPASMFEVGNPDKENGFAVSVRYYPEWGDEYAKILLIKSRGRSDYDYVSERLPLVHPGSVIRYAAGVLYHSDGVTPAGAHLWYRIDNGEVHHLFFESSGILTGWPLIRISKRYYYDDFGNNSICRSFAIVQGKVNEEEIGTVMGPGTVPDQLNTLLAT